MSRFRWDRLEAVFWCIIFGTLLISIFASPVLLTYFLYPKSLQPDGAGRVLLGFVFLAGIACLLFIVGVVILPVIGWFFEPKGKL